MSQSADTPEAIAIIGMAGRFPQAKNLQEFWSNLRAGRESVSFFKDDEVQWLPIEHPPRLDDPNYVKARAVLEKPEWFDAAFFGMNPREAGVTDPQHRVFLECAWESLENAGINPDTYPGMIGVFAGASMNSYLFTNLLTNKGLVENLGFFPTLIANDNDFIPTRVAYKFNLRGPAINVQTACSTSLVAVCLAAQSLLSYRCDVALAGGVSITFPPRRGQYHLTGGILSNDGHCRAFDAKATGTVLGDGAGVVVLKRLSEAIADGDPICAVIKGSAMNNDGSVKIGYTAPSSDGQAEAIAMAHAEAGFAPETISYIEAHGTGTPIGDPIEIEGLKKAFGLKGERGQFIGIGSVKSNIGHLDATAGVAGLIKTVLALQAKELPPSVHFESPNPKIDFAQSPFYVVKETKPWPRGTTPRRAGVSSFGIGGTNAHLALEEAPALAASDAARGPQLLTLSARTATALDAATANLAAHLEANPALNLADVAWTLQTGRKAFSHRRAVVARDLTDAVKRLRDASSLQIPSSSGGDTAGASGLTTAATSSAPGVAFLFPGQGSQHVDMARGLYEQEPVFRQHVDECCRLLEPVLGFDLRTLLFPAAASKDTAAQRLNETSITQPALFVIEYALARLWLSWGVQPNAMIGHSLGEYVAGCVSGVFSLADGLKLVALRAQLMQAQPRGAMLAVRLPESAAAMHATGAIAVAAVNAPELTVLSGPTAAIDALETHLIAQGIGAKRIATSHAFHSVMMEPVMAPLEAELRKIKLNAPAIPFVSNVTGTWITAAQATDPAYWSKHLRQAVRFADGVAALARESNLLLLEVGPGQTLATLARQHPAMTGRPAPLASLGRASEKADEPRAVAEALGRLWSAGVAIDWKKIHGGARRQKVALPTYPFERQRYVIEAGTASIAEGRVSKVEGQSQTVESAGANVEGQQPSTLDSRPSTASSLRTRLAALFSDLAGHDFSGENATRTFSELGMDSLALTQASFSIQERFDTKVSMRQLIEEYSTLEKLEAHLQAGVSAPKPEIAAGVADPGIANSPSPGSPAPATITVPLTQAQQEIWYASQISETMSAAYNESSTLHLRGELNEAALRGALADLTLRHESLRSTFPATGDQQLIAANATPDFAIVDLTSGAADEIDSRFQAALQTAITGVFDLVNGPLWRVRLLRLAADHHALVLVVHHIICDGWSQGVMAHDLSEFYSARVSGQPANLPAPVRFADYARQEAQRREANDATAENYWVDRFRDGAPVLELPGDRPRPITRTFAASHAHRTLAPETAEAIRRLAAQNDATTFTVLLAGFTTLLHRFAGQDDIVVGVPAAPQVLAGLKTLVGHCVNLLPIRSQIAENQSFASFLQATRRTTLDGFDHWQHPFANLLRRLNLPREANRMPLANVTFNVSRYKHALRFAGLTVEAASNPKGYVNFDINFNVTETGDSYVVDCNYSSELFDADTIARALDRYELVLRGAAADASRPVHRLPFVTPAERQKILYDWNDTETDYPRDQCLHELFEEQAHRTPDAIAVVGDTERWTYRQLDERANQIAHRLRKLGVKPETAVGVHAARTPYTVAALFGILKAGGFYVPLDPAYPADRVAYMLQDSRATVLITDDTRTAKAPMVTEARQLDLGRDWAEISREATSKPASFPHPGNLAYIIYTSGSTGRPKGVAIEHRNGVQLAYWGRDVFSAEELSGVLAGTSFSFDLSIFEIFVTLAWGGRILLAENPLAVTSFPHRHEVTLINTVPSVVAELVRLHAIPPSCQTIFMAGEALPDSLAETLLKIPTLRKVYEGYGPSEDTTFSSWGLRKPGVRSNLGRPFPNTQFYLLDKNLELVPPGVVGEICIAGEGLARGYLHQPGLTQQKFIRNPLSNAPAARLYRSGDLARQRMDNGLLEFAGRVDHQVKIRGFRVELGEIEAAICRFPGVRQATVLIHEPAPGDKRIVAYLTPPTIDLAALRASVAKDLPEYMVPAAFMPLEVFPLTANNKINRRALPPPDFSTAQAAAEPIAPRTVTEEIIAEIWCDVLRLPRVGVQDNFFALGGHSLLVTQVLARLKQAFDLDLPLRHVFEAPTIAGLAAIVEAALVEDIKATGIENEPTHDVAVAS